MRKTKLMKKTNMTKTKTSTTRRTKAAKTTTRAKKDDDDRQGQRPKPKAETDDGEKTAVLFPETVTWLQQSKCTVNEPLGQPGDPGTAEKNNAGTLAATPPPRQLNN